MALLEGITGHDLCSTKVVVVSKRVEIVGATAVRPPAVATAIFLPSLWYRLLSRLQVGVPRESAGRRFRGKM